MMEDKKEAMKRVIDKAKNAIQMPIPGKPGFPRPKPIMPGEKKEVIERVIYKARNA